MDWSFLIKNKESLNVTTDSRKVTPGCIFVALKGEHFDGNDFVPQVLEQGAEWVLMDNQSVYDQLPQELKPRVICSPSPCGEGRGEASGSLALLQDLARAWRDTLTIPVIGITGTNGKTTTKELCAAVLSTRYNVLYTQGNYNNSLGVPLTLLNITRAHEIAIIEMGASHPGDIKELVEIAKPTYGLITNAGMAHLQGFGSFGGVMRTKAELYEYIIEHDGKIFRNVDNPYLEQMQFDVMGDRIVHLIPYHTGTMPEGTHLVGGYNAENISAALRVGLEFGINQERALAAIRAYVPSNNRSQLLQTERNIVVVDAYNANPTSMQAAINAFANYQSPIPYPQCYILGAMRELGDYSHTEHQNIVNMLLERKVDAVLLVGEEYKQTTTPYPVFDNVDALCEYLRVNPIAGARILLKGSRSNQLEKVIPLL